MKYGKLNEDEQSEDIVERNEFETPQQEIDNTLTDESDQEMFMETEKKIKFSSTKKKIIYVCCGGMAILIIAIFAGYVFANSVDNDGNNNDTPHFISSPTDIYREFELITLDNSLQILLISDSKTDKSAAAIDVFVGSNEDPAAYLGLAHFHEHMLFLGSESYPKQDAFSSYVSMNGGNDNAYTDNTHTNFFFEINNNHLSHALDIFSRFFIDPLLTYDAIMSEIWAVDNEYRKDIPDQEWRDWRMLEYSANPNDPFSTFSIGSIQTLNKSGIYQAMKEFHNTYFVANMMKGVIYGNEDLDSLKAYAIRYFSQIPSLDIEAPKYEHSVPFMETEKGNIYFIKPMDSTKTLSFLWSFVGNEFDLHKNYRAPVLQFIDQIITSQTQHSLYSYLSKTMGWIHGINGEIVYDEYQWSGYLLSFELTDIALTSNNYQKIAKYLFEALHVLLQNMNGNDSNSNVTMSYDNYLCVERLNFKFYSLIKQEAYDAVSTIARRMQYRQTQDLLYSALNVPPIRSIYNQTLINNVLNYMNDPNNVIIYQIGDHYDGNYDLTEPYFGIEYANMEISDELIDEWSTNNEESALEFEYLNPFIDVQCDLEDIKLIELSESDKIYYWRPELIINESNINVWYKPDTQFNSSEISINLLLISPQISADVLNKTYTEIWIKLMEYMCSEWYSQANDAGYSFDISLDNQGIVIQINCINAQYLDVFIDQFFDYFINIYQYVSSSENIELILTNILNNLYDEYNNINFDSVWHQAYDKMYDIVEKPFYSHTQSLNQILNLQNATSITQHILNFISSIKDYGFLLEALFNGNLYKADIESKYLQKVLENIKLRDPQFLSSNSFIDNMPMFEHLNLKLNNNTKQWLYKGYNSNPEDSNDVNEFYFQFNENAQQNGLETCKVLLLSQMMSAESFQVLRTEEALGYVATSFSRTSLLTNNINYIVVLVASGHYSADYLQVRIIHFINYFYDTYLKEISDESFESYINATVSEINQKYLTLSDETSFLWDQIMGHTYFWNESNEFEQILRSQQITLSEIINFYEVNMLGENKKWLSVQLFSDKNTTFENNITRNDFNLSNKDFKHQFVHFNATKDMQNINDMIFFNVY